LALAPAGVQGRNSPRGGLCSPQVWDAAADRQHSVRSGSIKLGVLRSRHHDTDELPEVKRLPSCRHLGRAPAPPCSCASVFQQCPNACGSAAPILLGVCFLSPFHLQMDVGNFKGRGRRSCHKEPPRNPKKLKPESLVLLCSRLPTLKSFVSLHIPVPLPAANRCGELVEEGNQKLPQTTAAMPQTTAAKP